MSARIIPGEVEALRDQLTAVKLRLEVNVTARLTLTEERDQLQKVRERESIEWCVVTGWYDGI